MRLLSGLKCMFRHQHLHFWSFKLNKYEQFSATWFFSRHRDPQLQVDENYCLKGLAQAKIIKKSVILFWLLNMTIWCKHVHRLELQKFFNLQNSWFLIIDNHVKNKKYGNFVSISSLTGKCAAEKFKTFYSSSLWTCLHHMVILRSQNHRFLNDFSLGQSL